MDKGRNYVISKSVLLSNKTPCVLCIYAEQNEKKKKKLKLEGNVCHYLSTNTINLFYRFSNLFHYNRFVCICTYTQNKPRYSLRAVPTLQFDYKIPLLHQNSSIVYPSRLLEISTIHTNYFLLKLNECELVVNSIIC